MSIALSSPAIVTFETGKRAIGSLDFIEVSFTTDKATVADLAAFVAALYPYLWTDAVFAPPNPPLENPYTVGATTYYRGAIQPGFFYTISGSESTGTWYNAVWQDSDSPGNGPREQPGLLQVKFEIVSSVVVIHARLYFVTQMDNGANLPSLPNNADKLLKCIPSSPDAGVYDPGGSVFSVPAYALMQLLVIEDLSTNAYDSAFIRSGAAERKFFDALNGGGPPVEVNNPSFILSRGLSVVTQFSTQNDTLIQARADVNAVTIDYTRIYLIRTDAPTNASFYVADLSLSHVKSPLDTSENAAYGLQNLAFKAPDAVAAVTTLPQMEFLVTVDKTKVVVGASYRIIAVWVTSGGEQYAFISAEITASDCPELTPPTCTGFLADYTQQYGNSLIATPKERILSHTEFNGSDYDPQRTRGLVNGAVKVTYTAYYKETILGVTYKQTVEGPLYATRIGGAWQTASPGFSVADDIPDNKIVVEKVMRLRTDNLQNLATFNESNNVSLPRPTGTQDWRGKTIWIETALEIAQPAGWSDLLTFRQRIQVKDYDDTILSGQVQSLDGSPLFQLCNTQGEFKVVVSKTDAGNDYLIPVLSQTPFTNTQAKEDDTFAGYMPPLSAPEIPHADSYFTDNEATVIIDPSKLKQDAQYQLCIVKKDAKYCLDFNGNGATPNTCTGALTGGEYVSIPQIPEYDFGGGDYTVEFWIKIKALNGYQDVIGRGYIDGGDFTGSNHSAWGIYTRVLGAGTGCIAINRTYRAPSGTVNTTRQQFGNLTFAIGDFYHVVCRKVTHVVGMANPDTSLWSVWLNGVAVPPIAALHCENLTSAMDAAIDADLDDNNRPIIIGTTSYNGFEGNENNSCFQIYEARLYTRAISDAEILYSYNGGLGNDPQIIGDLVLWASMNQKSGTVVVDKCDLANNGVLVNYSPSRYAGGGGAWVKR